jgi:hypothetical protein
MRFARTAGARPYIFFALYPFAETNKPMPPKSVMNKIPEITNHSIEPSVINPLTIKYNPSPRMKTPSMRRRATTVDRRNSGLENENVMRRTLLARR